MATALFKRVRDNPPATSVRDDDALLAQPASGPDFYLTPNLFWQLWLQAKVEALTAAMFSPLGHRHMSDDITDSSALGRAILGALTAADVRILIGAQSTVIMMSELEAIQGTSDAQRLTSPRLQQVAATTAVKKIGGLPAVGTIDGSERLVAVTGAPADGPSGHITTGSLWNGFLRALVVAEGNARYSALGHTHTAIQITDATDVGRQVLTASTAIAARAAMGAQEAVPAMTEQEALDGVVTDQRTVSPRVLAIGAAKHGGGGGGSGLVPMTSAEAVAGVGTDPRSVSPAVLKAGVDARVDARLSGSAIGLRPSLHLDFTRQTLDPRLRFERASEAWELNAAGMLVRSPPNVLPVVHDLQGRPQGRSVYQALVNKLTCRTANPVDTAGMNLSGEGAVLEVVDDASELARAGLSAICHTGKVYRLTNSSASATAIITFSGFTGNTNPHSASMYVRGSGDCAMSFWGGGQSYTPLTAGYVRRISFGNGSSTDARAYVNVRAGGVVYFILPQLIETNVAGPVIPGDTLAAAMRAEGSATMPISGIIGPDRGTIVVRWFCPPQAFAAERRGPWWLSGAGLFNRGIGLCQAMPNRVQAAIRSLDGTAVNASAPSPLSGWTTTVVSYAPDQLRISSDGGAITRNVQPVQRPQLDTLHVGMSAIYGSATERGPSNGPMRFLTAYPLDVSDAEMLALGVAA